MKEFIVRYWIEALFAALLALMGNALKKLKKQQQEYECIKNGMKALLRSEIIAIYNHYADRKVLPLYARENLHSLYNEYKALGGNGAVKDLMEIASEWPTHDSELKIG